MDTQTQEAFGKNTVETNSKLLVGPPVLPEFWQSIFFHAELDLLLGIYVEDFKMGGPAKNFSYARKTVESVIHMDPPEPFGRYVGWKVDQQAFSF